jgi:cell division protein FtsB
MMSDCNQEQGLQIATEECELERLEQEENDLVASIHSFSQIRIAGIT